LASEDMHGQEMGLRMASSPRAEELEADRQCACMAAHTSCCLRGLCGRGCMRHQSPAHSAPHTSPAQRARAASHTHAPRRKSTPHRMSTQGSAA
jgi:hypothetical protein